jgi:hypothetical protein
MHALCKRLLGRRVGDKLLKMEVAQEHSQAFGLCSELRSGDGPANPGPGCISVASTVKVDVVQVVFPLLQ